MKVRRVIGEGEVYLGEVNVSGVHSIVQMARLRCSQECHLLSSPLSCLDHPPRVSVVQNLLTHIFTESKSPICPTLTPRGLWLQFR